MLEILQARLQQYMNHELPDDQADFRKGRTRYQIANIRWIMEKTRVPVFLGFPFGSAGKESSCNVGDLGLIPRLGRSPGEGKGYPLLY